MVHYECLYSSGRQFVFAEQSSLWLLPGLVAIAFTGLVVGLSIGAITSLAGLWLFDVLMILMLLSTVYQAFFLMFHREASSADVSSYIIGNLIFFGYWCLLLFLVRVSVEWTNMGAINRNIVFSVGGVVIGILFWGYHRLVLREDVRKHHLGLCSPSGAALHGLVDLFAGLPEEDLSEAGPVEDFKQFVVWILSWRWWLDLRDLPLASDEDSSPADCITVHNHTLKLIKVCMYSRDDMFCWVPFGGISGRCVAFVRAEEHRTFYLGRRTRCGSGRGAFQLKVFQPGVFDMELAYVRNARCGQSFTFSDVEGMVRRSKTLSSPLCQHLVATPKTRTEVSESSEEESPSSKSSPSIQGLLSGRGGLGALGRCSSGQLLRSCSSDPLRRALRQDSMSTTASMVSLGLSSPPDSAAPSPSGGLHAEPQGAEEALGSPAGFEALRPRAGSPFAEAARPRVGSPSAEAARPRLESRRAAPEEMVVRNKSNQDILVKLFRTNDFAFIVPVNGNIASGGDPIAPHAERRFDPKNFKDSEFTLKVYSVGPGAREVTYWMVRRGHAYIFNDSLLS